MKNNSILLFKIIVLNQFKINEIKEKHSKYRKNTILVGIAIAALVIMLAGYSYGIGYSLGNMGIAKVIPGYGITIVSIITLFFTILKSNGVLFGTRDYEMMVSLPIRTSTIIASRFFFMYVMNTLFALVIMIPLGAAYYLFEKPSATFFAVWLCGIVFATLLPTTLAAVIGGVIVYIASHFKYTNAAAILLSFLLVVGLLVSSVFMGGVDADSVNIMQYTDLGEMISKQINSLYPISRLFEHAVNSNNIGALLLFVLISAGWYLLFVKILSLKYKSINTAIMTHQTKSDYKIQKLKRSYTLTALYKKELKRFFSSYAYVLNIGMGAVMALIIAIAVFILEPDKLGEMMGISNIEGILIKIIAFAFSTVLAMSCTTSVSLSLEGKNLWILKSLPIKTKTIINSKILVNLTIILPIAVAFGILMNIKFKTDIITRIILFITPVIYSFFIAVWGMFINIKIPNYEWESETIVIKQGMSSMLGMLGGPVFALIPILIIFIFSNISYQFISLAAVIIIGGLAGFLYHTIGKYKL